MNPLASPALDKHAPDPDGLDFAGLRQAGIERLQQLCGEVWSDYNLHDPGITLLEQLCYGLSDLTYRSSYAAEDYLFGDNRQIDGPRHALLPPEEVLPSAPLTRLDYQKLLADALPGIRNVWVTPTAGDALPGLLDIHLQLADTLADSREQQAELLRQATELYHRFRNLGEDLGEIGVVGHIAYHLSGEIEIDNSRAPAEILADIYFACAMAISPPIPQRPYEDLALGELDGLFEGPLTGHGYIDSDNLSHWSGARLSELVQAVSQVDGVCRIAGLALLDDKGQAHSAAIGDQLAKRVPRLIVPRQIDELQIRLRKSGQDREVVIADFLDCLDHLHFAAETRHHDRPAPEPVAPLPSGAAADFGQYTSLQHELPAIYGIGRYGLPASAAPARRGQARQLQAYLLLFEQLMVNFQQGLQALPDLFSVDEAVDRSYCHRILDERDLPGIESLYLGGTPGADSGLRRILAQLDDFSERRSRALDFLLALHGESFDQNVLRNFIPGHRQDLDAKLLRTKIAFLRQAPRLNSRRMTAFNYRQPLAPDNMPALAEKLGLLLGLPMHPGRSMTAALHARNIRYLSDAEFLRESGRACLNTLEGEDVFPFTENATASGESILQLRLLCPALLNWGNDLGHYRMATEKPGEHSSCALYFAMGDESGYCRLSQHPDKRAALAEANRLSRTLGVLSSQSLGFHLLEHLLLRPVGTPTPADDYAFYAFRISAVFPTWSPRLCNPEFRKQLEQTLARCSPAHLSVEVVWLDFPSMTVFEQLYRQWLRQKASPSADPQRLDRLSRQLRIFLEEQEDKSAWRPSWL
jgi:hypothetical protein